MLFAAYRALPRLSVPRHPPCALIRLTGLCVDAPRLYGQSATFPHQISPTNTHFRCSLTPFPLTQFVNKDKSRFVSVRSTTPEVVRLSRTFSVPKNSYSSLQKGGDPAAGSPTATLLRLRPSHRARLRPLRPLAGFGHGLRALPASMA